ncbi:MAG: hypothetical protein KC501_31060 [Myxococcales bacterium]|nr:hypothetical protein [Myxococcales bacterium]
MSSYVYMKVLESARFRFDDGGVVPPAQVRRTRLDMLGRPTVEVPRD